MTEQLDVDSAKEVFDLMDSRNRSSVIYAMHLFDLLQRDKLTPEIKDMISEKADEVRVSSLSDLFNAEGCTVFPDSAEEVCREDLITDVREILSMDAYQELMRRHADRLTEDSAKSEIEKMELAKAIGLMSPEAPLTDRLEALIDDNSPDVSAYALKSAARLRNEKHIPAIIRRLGDPRVREDAIDALHKYGGSARRALEENLADSRRALPVRTAVVEVLARLGTQEAASTLMDVLERGTGELDPEIIDALDRIRTEKPGDPVPRPGGQEKDFIAGQKILPGVSSTSRGSKRARKTPPPGVSWSGPWRSASRTSSNCWAFFIPMRRSSKPIRTSRPGRGIPSPTPSSCSTTP